MNNFFHQTFLSNTVEDYSWFFGILLLGIIFKRILSTFITKFLFKFVKKYAETISRQQFVDLLRKPIDNFLLLIIIFLGFQHIQYPLEWNLKPANELGLIMVMERSYQIIVLVSFTWIILRFVDFTGLILVHKASKTESKQDDQIIPFVIDITKIFVCIFSLFFVLGSIFNLNVASLVAGLGIGGLAIALAAKESLENLLGSFTIFFDKPFVVGDLVKVGGLEGVVEKVGFRSTRIRTPEKSFVTIPNKKMVDAELDNLSLRTFRRVRFNITLTYETSPEKLKTIINEIQSLIDHHKNTSEEGRVRLYELGKNGIDIRVIYFINSTDWNLYVDLREEINFKIMEIVRKNGSNFAYPTSTVYINKYE